MEFHKLSGEKNSWTISHKKPFPVSAPVLKEKTIRRVFEFSYSMTFGTVGEHRNHRTGGSLQRKKGEIFANTFQGKLAECAACNLFYKIDPSVSPDFSIANLGVWDSVDMVVNNKKISVKSTKSYGNLLLLEQHDWNEQGEYIPNLSTDDATYDYFLLIRINPFCENIMEQNKLLKKDEVDKNQLWEIISNNQWKYDFAGYITHSHLKQIIKDEFVIHKGDSLNGITIDADNYYIQAGDMLGVENLLQELK